MNLTEYKKETQRTFAYVNNGISNELMDKIHCAIGISTEAAELLLAYENYDPINIGEEIADIMWYVSNMLRFYNVDEKNIIIPEKNNVFENKIVYIKQIVLLSGEILNLFKRELYYKKQLNQYDLEEFISDIIKKLVNLCYVLNLDFETLLDKNIRKLKIRFPDKFTQENAINRKLDEERRELEK